MRHSFKVHQSVLSLDMKTQTWSMITAHTRPTVPAAAQISLCSAGV